MESPIYYKIKKIFSSIFLQMFLVGVAASCIFPLLWMVGSSLKTQSTVFSDMSLFPRYPHWQNYFTAWTQGSFGSYFFNSVLYTVVTVVCIVLFTSMAAYGISRLRIPGKNIVFYVFLAAMIIPIPGSFVALYAMLIEMGFINPHTGSGLLDNIIKRMGYILPQITQGLSLGIFMLKTFFDKLPKDLEDSAHMDGCGKFGVYWHIALPLAKPAIAVIVIVNVLYVWNEYLFAMLILTDKSLMPIMRGLMVFQGAHVTQYSILMAGTTIAAIPIIIIYLFLQKHIVAGITAGAVKG